MPGDRITITQNTAWFPSYDYCLCNFDTGKVVEVNLSLGPAIGSPFTHWIDAIDYRENVVILEDGSRWSITSRDSSAFRRWMPGDIVIVGANDGWLSGSRPFILIDVAANTFARAYDF